MISLFNGDKQFHKKYHKKYMLNNIKVDLHHQVIYHAWNTKKWCQEVRQRLLGTAAMGDITFTFSFSYLSTFSGKTTHLSLCRQIHFFTLYHGLHMV